MIGVHSLARFVVAGLIASVLTFSPSRTSGQESLSWTTLRPRITTDKQIVDLFGKPIGLNSVTMTFSYDEFNLWKLAPIRWPYAIEYFETPLQKIPPTLGPLGKSFKVSYEFDQTGNLQLVVWTHVEGYGYFDDGGRKISVADIEAALGGYPLIWRQKIPDSPFAGIYRMKAPNYVIDVRYLNSASDIEVYMSKEGAFAFPSEAAHTSDNNSASSSSVLSKQTRVLQPLRDISGLWIGNTNAFKNQVFDVKKTSSDREFSISLVPRGGQFIETLEGSLTQTDGLVQGTLRHGLAFYQGTTPTGYGEQMVNVKLQLSDDGNTLSGTADYEPLQSIGPVSSVFQQLFNARTIEFTLTRK